MVGMESLMGGERGRVNNHVLRASRDGLCAACRWVALLDGQSDSESVPVEYIHADV